MSLIKRITLTGLAISLVFVGTLLLHFHIGASHPNLGDTFIFIFSFLLGPVCGGIAGGLGSFFADLVDYPTTALMTLVIKTIMAVVAGLLFKTLKNKATTRGKTSIIILLITFVSSLIMIGGYFICKTFLYGTLESALFSLLTNTIQMVANMILTTILYYFLSKTHLFSFFNTK